MKKILVLTLVLALVAAIAAPLTALAADNDTQATDVQGEVPATIEVSPPGGFDLGSLVPGTDVYSGSKPLSISSNIPWTLEVEANGSGHLYNANNTLAHSLEMQGGEGAGNVFQSQYAPLTGSFQLYAWGNPTIAHSLNFTLKQIVAFSDPPGTYSTTIYFQGTPTP